METKRFFHYTCGHHINEILESGLIKKEKEYTENMRPATWISSNPLWENTVKKTPPDVAGGVGVGIHAKLFGAYRIEINPANVVLHSWTDYKRNSGVSATLLKNMQKIAQLWGANVYDWYCCYDDIPINEKTVLSVGVYRNNGMWEDMSLDDFKKQMD